MISNLKGTHTIHKQLFATTIATLLTVSSHVYAQSAVRDEFPTGGNRGNLFEYFTKDQWDSSNYATPEAMKAFQDLRYGMFLCFGPTVKSKSDLSWGSINPRYAPDKPSIMANGQLRTEPWTTWYKEMNLENFNATEWVEIARKSGFKYIVIITKHHDGFHMWDTAFSDFKITKAPFGRDYIKEVADACHKAKFPIGFYFAQREWYHPDYQPVDLNKVTQSGVNWILKPGETSPLGPRHSKYLEYMNNAVRELCTQYGKIDIWWWDAVSWNGMFTKEMWDAENTTRMIRELQPGIVINNRASVPGDFDTMEQHLGTYQDWRPWESCIPLCGHVWSYTGKPPHTFDHILKLIAGSACGNGNLLLSWSPRFDGGFDEEQKQRLFEIGDWLKINGESIYSTRGGPWKPTAWGGSTRNGKIAYIHLFQRPKGALALPSIPQRQVVSAKLLASGETVAFKQTASWLSLSIPSTEPIKGDLVVALTMDGTLDALSAISVDDLCGFAVDPATYGTVISRTAKVKASSASSSMPADGGASLVAEKQPAQYAVYTKAEEEPFVEIDLGKVANVTGLFIRNSENRPQLMATLHVSISSDGKTWTEVWKAEKAENTWEFPVTEFVSGVQVPGSKAQFIRLQTNPGSPQNLILKQVEVYGNAVSNSMTTVAESAAKPDAFFIQRAEELKRTK